MSTLTKILACVLFVTMLFAAWQISTHPSRHGNLTWFYEGMPTGGYRVVIDHVIMPDECLLWDGRPVAVNSKYAQYCWSGTIDDTKHVLTLYSYWKKYDGALQPHDYIPGWPRKQTEFEIE